MKVNATFPQLFFKHFASINQLPILSVSGALVENGLSWLKILWRFDLLSCRIKDGWKEENWNVKDLNSIVKEKFVSPKKKQYLILEVTFY